MSPARRAILLVVSLLVLPFAIALGLYYFGWRPGSTGNYGELLQPPLKLPTQGLRRDDGRPLPTAELRGKWLLVLASDAPCAVLCQQRLHDLRQIQVSMNKEMGRLSRVWLGRTVADDPALPALKRAYPDLVIAAPEPGLAGQDWRTVLTDGQLRLYVVDPLGNLVLRYPETPDLPRLRRDVERLLKYSWVG